jgi:NADPH2:quinone reductase
LGGYHLKAIRIHEHGGPEVLVLEDIPQPEPGSDQVLIKVAASGLNFIDTYHRTGLYPVELPLTLGLEGSGVIESVGSEVSGFSSGDRVAWAGCPGSYAEYLTAPAAKVVKIPDGVSFESSAAAMLQGMTVHYLTHSTYPLKAGDTALVHAAAGGVGLIMVQVAKMLGARVIGTCGSAEKADLAKGAGADEVILYTEKDFEAETRKLTDGVGVDVAYDSVGKSTWEKSMNCLRPRGYLVLFGNASGAVPPIDPLVLSQKGSLFMTRPTLVSYTLTREELLGRANDILGWIDSGSLNIRVDRTVPLSDAADAHRALESRATKGKVLIQP